MSKVLPFFLEAGVSVENTSSLRMKSLVGGDNENLESDPNGVHPVTPSNGLFSMQRNRSALPSIQAGVPIRKRFDWQPTVDKNKLDRLLPACLIFECKTGVSRQVLETSPLQETNTLSWFQM
jgi:hypothetical protein